MHRSGIRAAGETSLTRVEKYISPGEKVELLALIGEFVFTIGLEFLGEWGLARV